MSAYVALLISCASNPPSDRRMPETGPSALALPVEEAVSKAESDAAPAIIAATDAAPAQQLSATPPSDAPPSDAPPDNEEASPSGRTPEQKAEAESAVTDVSIAEYTVLWSKRADLNGDRKPEHIRIAGKGKTIDGYAQIRLFVGTTSTAVPELSYLLPESTGNTKLATIVDISKRDRGREIHVTYRPDCGEDCPTNHLFFFLYDIWNLSF